jgi:protein gp37
LRFGQSKKPWSAVNAQENVRLHSDRLLQPLRWRGARRIFVNSMSDLFHELVPDTFVFEVFRVMTELAPHHTYQILTKRPDRMRDVVGAWLAQASNVETAGTMLPRHVWLGTSVEDQRAADQRIPVLLQAAARVRFLSCEPLLGPVDLAPWIESGGLHWVIVGGESGPRYRPIDLQWVRMLRDRCLTAGVPFFFKQVGGLTPRTGGRNLDGTTWDQYPAETHAALS